MRRAPWPVGLLFGVSLALLIVLVGPLLLFSPAFSSALQQRHGVAEAFSTTQAEVDRVTAEVLGDLWSDGEFDAAFSGGEPLLDERERSHMHDVAVLVRTLAAVVASALAVALVTGFWLRQEPRRQGDIMLTTAAVVAAAAFSLAILFAVAFETMFLAFHAVFFPPGTFLFEPGSNLITLFPQGFWFEAALAAGASVVIGGLFVAGIGLWRRGSAATPESA
jgi:hypothetical protein